jgi:hypothetical protein
MNELHIAPESLFSFELDCRSLETFSMKEKMPPLADTQGLFGRKPFAKLFMGWHESGLCFRVHVSLQSGGEMAVFYPNITSGDAIELFIDTRDVKQARTTHRYCHHFFFLPEGVDGVSCGEITRFRTEDTHELASPDDLELDITRQASSYTADIAIPKSALCGYDPQQGSYLGFSYRLHRPDGAFQSLGFADDEVRSIERFPYLWSSVRLT